MALRDNHQRQIWQRHSLVFVFVIAGAAWGYHAWQSIQQSAYLTSCVSQLKAIGLAVAQYTHDYDRTLPRAWYGRHAGPSDATNYKWMDAIAPYLKEEESFFNCPGDRENRSYQPRHANHYGSYVFNNAYYKNGDKFTPPGGKKLSEIAAASGLILLADGRHDFQFAWPDAQSAPDAAKAKYQSLGSITTRHKTPATLFVDGRASNYGLHQDLASKNIKGQRIYSGLTIEND
jgi:hypothetical protein